MTGLLVSVRDAGEARAALQGGADLIDIKEPLRGPLGPADPEVWRQVAQAVDGQRPISAALGELVVAAMPQASQVEGMRWVKIGLAGCLQQPDWPQRWAAAVAKLPPHVEAVPVLYADWEVAESPPPQQVLQWAAAGHARGLVLDTFDKQSGPLTALWSFARLDLLVQQVRSFGLRLVLAGRLDLTTLKAVVTWRPDYVGVRGAVCRGGRDGTVDTQLVKTLRRELRRLVGPASACSLTPREPTQILPA